VFASCIVGSLRIEAGIEPSGLAVSCLLRGTASIVAGVIEVHMWAADRLCVSTVARLMNGQPPAEALRAAQLAFLSGRETASPHRWAGYICISRMQQQARRPIDWAA
jgi:CHAT domain-containing protein